MYSPPVPGLGVAVAGGLNRSRVDGDGDGAAAGTVVEPRVATRTTTTAAIQRSAAPLITNRGKSDLRLRRGSAWSTGKERFLGLRGVAGSKNAVGCTGRKLFCVECLVVWGPEACAASSPVGASNTVASGRRGELGAADAESAAELVAGNCEIAGVSGGVDGLAGAAMAKPGVGAKTGTGSAVGIAHTRSATATSVMLCGRCAGSLRSMRASKLSRAGVSDGSRSLADGGTSVEWAMISSPAP